MENKQNDWFATLVFQPELGMNDLAVNNITPDNTGLLTKEEYKEMPEVASLFTKDDEFDENTFNKAYDSALVTYNAFTSEQFENQAIEEYIYDSGDWFAPTESKKLDKSAEYISKTDAPENAYGITSIREKEDIYKSMSAREIGQTSNVWDSEKEEWLDWTPNDKNVFSAIAAPTLVLASWDEDGEHETNGNKVAHKTGELKYNEYGKTYYETLGKRDSASKDVLHVWDVATTDGSAWNKIDFMDSDGLDKSIVGTVAKTAFTVAPLLIPGVGQWYGAISAGLALSKAVPSLMKSINGIITNDNSNSFGSAMNVVGSWASRFDSSKSDYARDHIATWENLGELVVDTSSQLFQQRVIGAIPRLIKGKNLIEKDVKLGRQLSLAYMALTSSQESYNAFKEGGASDRVAGLGMLASMGAMYGLMNSDYFRETLFKGSYLDESLVRTPANQVIKEIQGSLGVIEANPKTGFKMISKLFDSKVGSAVKKMSTSTKMPNVIGAGSVVHGAANEAIEETMEEVSNDAIKAFFSGVNALGIPMNDKDGKLSFDWSVESAVKRYGMAAAGGFLGGSVFAGFGKWDSRMSNVALKHDKTGASELTYLISQGHADEIRDYYSDMHAKGKLGNTNLSATKADVDADLGTNIFLSATPGQSQNDAVYNALTEHVNYVESIMSEEGLLFSNAMLEENLLEQLMEVGNSDRGSEIRSDVFTQLVTRHGLHNRLLEDFKFISTEIVQNRAELDAAIKNKNLIGSTDDEQKANAETANKDLKIKKVKGKLTELRNKRDDIISGKKNGFYYGQSLFTFNNDFNSKFGDMSLEAYSEHLFGKNYHLADVETQEYIKAKHQEYMEDKGQRHMKDSYDMYYSLSSKFKDRIESMNTSDLNLSGSVDGEQSLRYGEDMQRIAAEAIEAREDVDKYVEENKIDKVLFSELAAIIISKYAKNEDAYGKELQDQITKMKEAGLSENTVTELADKIDVLSNKLRTTTLLPNLFTMSQGNADFEKYFDVDIDSSSEMVSKLDSGNTISFDGFNGRVSRFEKALTGIKKMISVSKANNKPVDPTITAPIKEHLKTFNLELGKYAAAIWNSGDLELESKFSIYGGHISEKISNLFKSYIDNIDNKEKRTDAKEKLLELLNVEDLKNDIDFRHAFDDNNNPNPLEAFFPKLNGVDFFDAIDGLFDAVEDAPKDQVFDFLTELSKSVYGEKTNNISVIADQKRWLSSQSDLTEYIINDDAVLEQMKSILDLIKIGTSLLEGAAKGGLNGRINLLNNPKGAVLLAELDEDHIKSLISSIREASKDVELLMKLSEMNKLRRLKVHNDIERNMRPKFIEAILGDEPRSKKIQKVFTDVGINLSELWENAGGIPFNQELTMDTVDTYSMQVISFEESIFKAVKEQIEDSEANDSDLKINFVSGLVRSLGDGIWKPTNTNLSDNDKETIKDRNLLTYLLDIASTSSNTFYHHLGKIVSDPKHPYAPVYSQEMAIRNAWSFALNGTMYGMAAQEISNVLKEKFEDSQGISDKDVVKIDGIEYHKNDIEYLSNMPTWDSMFVVLGGAGTGKTTAVGKTLKLLLDNSDAEIIAMGPSVSQAKKLAASLELPDSTDGITKNDLINMIREEGTADLYENEKSHSRLKASTITSNTPFKSDKLRVLVFDEISLFTEAELTLINNWAAEQGVRIIGLGDKRQDSATVDVDYRDKKVKNPSGITDGIYLSCASLTASLRTGNAGKIANANRMQIELDRANSFLEENPMINERELSKHMDSNLSTPMTLLYDEGFVDEAKTKWEVRGEKIVDTTEAAVSDVERLKSSGSVLIITDNPAPFSKFINNTSGEIVEIRTPENAVGGEFDFTVVVPTANSVRSTYTAVQHIYTMSQRSRIGTIIVNANKVSEIARIKSTKDKNAWSESQLSNTEINSFKERKGKLWNAIPAGEDDDLNLTYIPVNKALVSTFTTVSEPKDKEGDDNDDLDKDIKELRDNADKALETMKDKFQETFKKSFDEDVLNDFLDKFSYNADHNTEEEYEEELNDIQKNVASAVDSYNYKNSTEDSFNPIVTSKINGLDVANVVFDFDTKNNQDTHVKKVKFLKECIAEYRNDLNNIFTKANKNMPDEKDVDNVIKKQIENYTYEGSLDDDDKNIKDKAIDIMKEVVRAINNKFNNDNNNVIYEIKGGTIEFKIQFKNDPDPNGERDKKYNDLVDEILNNVKSIMKDVSFTIPESIKTPNSDEEFVRVFHERVIEIIAAANNALSGVNSKNIFELKEDFKNDMSEDDFTALNNEFYTFKEKPVIPSSPNGYGHREYKGNESNEQIINKIGAGAISMDDFSEWLKKEELGIEKKNTIRIISDLFLRGHIKNGKITDEKEANKIKKLYDKGVSKFSEKNVIEDFNKNFTSGTKFKFSVSGEILYVSFPNNEKYPIAILKDIADGEYEEVSFETKRCIHFDRNNQKRIKNKDISSNFFIGGDYYVIVNNSSAQKTEDVKRFIEKNSGKTFLTITDNTLFDFEEFSKSKKDKDKKNVSYLNSNNKEGQWLGTQYSAKVSEALSVLSAFLSHSGNEQIKSLLLKNTKTEKNEEKLSLFDKNDKLNAQLQSIFGDDIGNYNNKNFKSIFPEERSSLIYQALLEVKESAKSTTLSSVIDHIFYTIYEPFRINNNSSYKPVLHFKFKKENGENGEDGEDVEYIVHHGYKTDDGLNTGWLLIPDKDYKAYIKGGISYDKFTRIDNFANGKNVRIEDIVKEVRAKAEEDGVPSLPAGANIFNPAHMELKIKNAYVKTGEQRSGMVYNEFTHVSLYRILSAIVKNNYSITDLDNVLANSTSFSHGIYMMDVADKADVSGNSFVKRMKGNTDDYTVLVGKIEGSVFKFNGKKKVTNPNSDSNPSSNANIHKETYENKLKEIEDNIKNNVTNQKVLNEANKLIEKYRSENVSSDKEINDNLSEMQEEFNTFALGEATPNGYYILNNLTVEVVDDKIQCFRSKLKENGFGENITREDDGERIILVDNDSNKALSVNVKDLNNFTILNAYQEFKDFKSSVENSSLSGFANDLYEIIYKGGECDSFIGKLNEMVDFALASNDAEFTKKAMEILEKSNALEVAISFQNKCN